MPRKKIETYTQSKNQLFKLLYGLYHTKVPAMIWGNPGGGKTSTVSFLGQTLGVPTEIRSGNKSDPTDFSGIPYLSGKDADERVLIFSEPKYARIMKNNPNGILFFDEITTCSPMIQVALLSIIQDCQFGEFEIPKSIFRIAAGNYSNITGTHNMSLALMNRFCHIFYEMDIDFFTDGFVSGWKNYEECRINSPEEQVDKVLKYRLAVVDFVKKNPDYLNSFPTDGVAGDAREFAYSTPRSWEMTVKILSVLDSNESSFIEELVKGCIGEDAGSFFMKYINGNKKKSLLDVDLPSYVGREDEFLLPNPDRHDQASHLMSSMVYYLEHDPHKYMDLWIRIVNVLHNKDNAFGDYGSYDNLIMKYIFKNVKLLLEKQCILPGEVRAFSKRISCYNLLGLSAIYEQ